MLKTQRWISLTSDTKMFPTVKHKRDSCPNSLSDGHEHNWVDPSLGSRSSRNPLCVISPQALLPRLVSYLPPPASSEDLDFSSLTERLPNHHHRLALSPSASFTFLASYPASFSALANFCTAYFSSPYTCSSSCRARLPSFPPGPLLRYSVL